MFLLQKVNVRAQSSVEFMMVIGMVLLFSLLFILFFYESYEDKLVNDRNDALLDVALDVQNEFSLALRAGEGYMRTFSLPANVYGKEYAILLLQGTLYIHTLDNRSALAVPVVNATGTLAPGKNNLYTFDGRVYVNATS